MITGLMKNNFTQKLATGAAALGVLAGVGLASAPAQAGAFTLNAPTGSSLAAVQDSEWGFPGPEAIWSTFPGGGTTPCLHGQTICVQGYDNPTINYTPAPQITTFKIEYFGSGNATQLNNFLWNGNQIFGPPVTGVTDTCADPNTFATVCKMVTVASAPPLGGALPFQFRTNLPVNPTNVNNGQAPSFDPNGNVTGAHYFATINGTWATTSAPNPPQVGDMVFLGFSDGNGGLGTDDDDAADFVIKITAVPEPLTLGGVALAAAFGAAFKRKLNKSDREKN